MPELPEAETIATGLRNCITGKRIIKIKCRTKSLRRPISQKKLNNDCAGAKITDVTRRGKAIIVSLTNKKAIIIQLGMTGACRVCPTTTPPLKHEHILFELSGNKSWRYEDPRRFGMVESFDPEDIDNLPLFLKTIGPEPLSDNFSANYLYSVIKNRKAKIKEIILNQHIVAGIGNIYASEILFCSKIHPATTANNLTIADCRRIVKHTKKILAKAIAAGGTTISDYKDVNGNEGKFSRELLVYGRNGEKCPECHTLIESITIGGRSSFFCPECQVFGGQRSARECVGV